MDNHFDTYKPHTLAILESPFAAGTTARRKMLATYALACMQDMIGRGEAPFASHLLYPQVLNDNNPEERKLGIAMGLAWGDQADCTVAYYDHGVSAGMVAGIDRAFAIGRPVYMRTVNAQARREGMTLSSMHLCALHAWYPGVASGDGHYRDFRLKNDNSWEGLKSDILAFQSQKDTSR